MVRLEAKKKAVLSSVWRGKEMTGRRNDVWLREVWLGKMKWLGRCPGDGSGLLYMSDEIVNEVMEERDGSASIWLDKKRA